MPDRPILLFAAGEVQAERAERNGGPPSDVILPARGVQAERLGPKFAELARQLRNRELRFRDDPAAAHPSEVLVFELVGSAPDFYRAVSRINGLAWLLDINHGEIEQDEYFRHPKKPEVGLTRRVLAVSANRTALIQLVALFRKYRRGEKLPRNFGSFSELFAHIKDVRPWEFRDRIYGTGLEEYLQAAVTAGESHLVCAIELFSSGSAAEDSSSVERARSVIISNDGEVYNSVSLPEIRHIEIRARLSIRGITRVSELESIAVFRLGDVMFVRPRAQAAVEYEENGEGREDVVDQVLDAPSSGTRLALLDGVPVQNHPLLQGRLLLDDPDDFESQAPMPDRIHGTGMASLILYGDLAEHATPLRDRIYVRPILLPRPGLHSTVEEIPSHEIPVDVVHRSVARLFSANSPAPEVRIICLCVADAQRPLDAFVSPWARLLDYLSWKYGVLFVVSAGNHAVNIELPFASDAFPALASPDVDAALMKHLLDTRGARPLLSPAEAINAITVGASSSDAAPATRPGIRIPLTDDGAERPTMYSANGGGVRRIVKPELFFPGGRQGFQVSPLSPIASTRLQTLNGRVPPGQEVASPPRSVAILRGTSNAAAIAARSGLQILDVIQQLFPAGSIDRHREAALLKAMIAHSATWGSSKELFAQLLSGTVRPQAVREHTAYFVGYGFPKTEQVLECTESRITVVAAGRVQQERGLVFRFPLPPALASRTMSRTIVTTLGFLTNVDMMDRAYRAHNVWVSHTFRGQPIEDGLAVKTTEAHDPFVTRGTLQHLRFSGVAAVPFIDGDFLRLQVNCKKDSGPRIAEGIPFGLVATLEVHENIGVDLYQQVRARIGVPVQIQSVSVSP